MEVYLSLAAVLLVTFSGQCQASYSDSLRDVLKKADKNVVPSEANGGPVDVAMGFTILQIQEREEDDSRVAVDLWMSQEWMDRRLTFDDEDNKLLHVPSEDIWTPDMLFYDSINPVTDSQFVKVAVFRDGKVTYVPRYRVRVSCERNGPSGLTCRLKIGSWVYSSDFVTLKLTSDQADLSNLSPTSDMDVENTRVIREAKKYDCCPETYEDIVLTLNLRRKN